MKIKLLLITLLVPLAISADVVKAVLFFSPTCPHCKQFEKSVLPDLKKQFGNDLILRKVNVSTKIGKKVYHSAVEWLPIPPRLLVLPSIIVGVEIFAGNDQIKEHLPCFIKLKLQQGGIGFPKIPALEESPSEDDLGPVVAL